jgi:hypothetical protein
MMSEREDVAVKRNKCLAAQQAFREALAALESLPQQLLSLTGRVPQQLPPDTGEWAEHNTAPPRIGPAAGLMRTLRCRE